MLVDDVAEEVREIFHAAAEANDMVIDSLEVMEDQVHIFLSAPPRYSPAQVVQILKSVSAREVFRRYPWHRQRVWGSSLWEEGYLVRSVADEVTGDWMRRYIRYQKHATQVELKLWDSDG